MLQLFATPSLRCPLFPRSATRNHAFRFALGGGAETRLLQLHLGCESGRLRAFRNYIRPGQKQFSSAVLRDQLTLLDPSCWAAYLMLHMSPLCSLSCGCRGFFLARLRSASPRVAFEFAFSLASQSSSSLPGCFAAFRDKKISVMLRRLDFPQPRPSPY